LLTLTRDFWYRNKHKEFINHQTFVKALSTILSTYHGDTAAALSPDFMSIIAEEFSLNTEGFSNSLHHSSLFDQWCSECNHDRDFGSIGSFFTTDLSGKNTFAFPPINFPQLITLCLDRTRALIESEVATRIVLLLPESVEHKFIVVARFPASSIFAKKASVDTNFALILALNKHSTHLDPINWPSVVAKFKEWSPLVDIPCTTDSLFRERLIPIHQPRCFPRKDLSQRMRVDSPGLLSFHRPLADAVDKKQLTRANLPPLVVSTLAKINQHKFSLSALSILPNGLRKILLAHGQDPEPLLDSLRKVFFWGGYKIWKTRNRLIKHYWKSKGQDRSKQRHWKGRNVSNCKHPFHFLKKIADLSKQRLTRCPCSRIQRIRSPLPDIRTHLKITQNTSLKKGSQTIRSVLVRRSHSKNLTDHLDHKHLPILHKDNRSPTQADAIRSEHDRGKKRKLTQLSILQVLPCQPKKRESSLPKS
jgi:hypothetical protein